MAPTVLAIAGLALLCGVAGEMAEGEIALSEPQCEFFVVHTASGFSLVNERNYFGLYEGDLVRGLLNAPGLHAIQVVGEMTVDATVESWGLDRAEATRVFHRRCRTRPPVNHDRD